MHIESTLISIETILYKNDTTPLVIILFFLLNYGSDYIVMLCGKLTGWLLVVVKHLNLWMFLKNNYYLPAAAWHSSKLDGRLFGFPRKTRKISSSFSLSESAEVEESGSEDFDKTKSSGIPLESLLHLLLEFCALNFSASLWKSKVLVETKSVLSSFCQADKLFCNKTKQWEFHPSV